MGYDLNAIIAKKKAIDAIVEQYEHAFPREVGSDLTILPHVTPFLQMDDSFTWAYDDHFWYLYESLVATIVDASVISPVSYVEADYFGGVGGQAAIVWSEKKVVYGPNQITHKDFEGRSQRVPKQDSPISQALRHLGVKASGRLDEFDTVRLGHIRHTLLWTPQEWRDQYADGYR